MIFQARLSRSKALEAMPQADGCLDRNANDSNLKGHRPVSARVRLGVR